MGHRLGILDYGDTFVLNEGGGYSPVWCDALSAGTFSTSSYWGSYWAKSFATRKCRIGDKRIGNKGVGAPLRRIALLVLLLVFALTPVFAQEPEGDEPAMVGSEGYGVQKVDAPLEGGLADIGLIDLTWDNVNGYPYLRYQRDAQADDGWTVVEGSVAGVRLPYHAGLNSYYLQSSLDGVNWSPSSVSTYTGLASGTNLSNESNGDNAHLQGASYETKKYELSLKGSPYALQHIAYSGNHTPQSRTSLYGTGAGLGFVYNFEPRLGVGANISYEWHNFKDFHYYHDIKADVRIRYRAFVSNNLRYKLYLEHGVGADFVLRDDGDKGCYALFAMMGLNEDLMLTNAVSLKWGCDILHTFQDGSSVLHFTTFIGIAYHWGSNDWGNDAQ